MIELFATLQISAAPACYDAIWPETQYIAANGRGRRNSTRATIRDRVAAAFDDRSLQSPGAITNYLIQGLPVDAKRKGQLRREFTPKIQRIWNSGACRSTGSPSGIG